MAKSKQIPSWGRKQSHIEKEISSDTLVGDITGDMGWHLKTKMGSPEDFAADMPIGTNSVPSMARGVIEGPMPNWPRMARGRLIAQRGRYGRGSTSLPIP